MALASLIIVMNKGRIEDMGPPARVYARPATRFTAGFMGESTQIEGVVQATGSEAVTVRTALGEFVLPSPEAWRPGAAVALLLRPENIRADGSGDVALGEARIVEVIFQGAHQRVLAKHASGQDFLLRLAPDAEASAGLLLQLRCRRADLVLLEA